MDAYDREINFRTVASEAKVSTAWLYGQEESRVRIMLVSCFAARGIASV